MRVYQYIELTPENDHQQQEKGRPLPKFGEWDVNNPASAEGFTVIFTKARDEKKSNGAVPVGAATSTSHQDMNPAQNYERPVMVKEMVVLFLRSAVLLLWGCMLRETLEKLRVVFMNCALYKSLRWTRETGKMVISQAHEIRQGEKG
ncbi:hypothetical protein SAY87_010273 [Trapa incisa]|uniref:RIN4 pathogenic type III effector avirulence factor Avr cleavage site domain-containing protein n=1 Tax=Trapa incisa TaxID=236973 RepID=A0AAN7JAR4_9MYRT|nr:hypothetical protein SAY87_010273 [Trapa incisa]